MTRSILFTLPPFRRGFHVITREVIQAVGELPSDGILHLFIQHTSAALAINEAADPDVLTDFESIFDRLVPEHLPFLTHTVEGPDDMPAHIKAALTQTSIGIPVSGGRLALGTWQGLYLFEHRDRPHTRQVVLHLSA